MNKYLLDTNICIYYLKGMYNLKDKILEVDIENCYISEITLAELKFGAENSKKVEENNKVILQFAERINIVPFFNAIDIYAKEKVRLRRIGKPIDDFDLLIGASAIANKLILVTNNVKDFRNLKNIKIENWTV